MLYISKNNTPKLQKIILIDRKTPLFQENTVRFCLFKSFVYISNETL